MILTREEFRKVFKNRIREIYKGEPNRQKGLRKVDNFILKIKRVLRNLHAEANPTKEDIDPLFEAYDRRVRGKNWKKAKSVGLVSGRTSPNSLIRKGYKI